MLSELSKKNAFSNVFPTWNLKWKEYSNTVNVSCTKETLWIEVSQLRGSKFPLIQLKSFGTYTNEYHIVFQTESLPLQQGLLLVKRYIDKDKYYSKVAA